MTQLRACGISRGREIEIHKSTQNTAKFSRNFIKYLSVQHICNLSQQIHLETSSLKRANIVLRLPGVDYVAKTWALGMMLKALPLVHFWSVLLLREQMMTSVRKTFKMLVWSAQNRSISSEFSLKISIKSAVFTDCFLRSLLQKFSRNWPIFPRICPLTSRKTWLFSATF